MLQSDTIFIFRDDFENLGYLGKKTALDHWSETRWIQLFYYSFTKSRQESHVGVSHHRSTYRIRIVNEYFRTIIGNFSMGFAFPCALYLVANVVNGVPEGPYYYDAESFQPEEWEYYENPLARLFYKYVVPSTTVSQWYKSLWPISHGCFNEILLRSPTGKHALPINMPTKWLAKTDWWVIIFRE